MLKCETFAVRESLKAKKFICGHLVLVIWQKECVLIVSRRLWEQRFKTATLQGFQFSFRLQLDNLLKKKKLANNVL